MRRQNRSYSNRARLIALAGGIAAGVLLIAILAAIFAPRPAGRGPVAALKPQVQFFVTTAAPVTETPTPAPAAVPTEAPTPIPTPTPQVTQYIIVEGDTLWDIAVRFGLSIDALIAVNPNINPDLVRPGDVVNLPGPNVVIPTRAPAAQSSAPAQVSLDGGGLRLRQGPSTSDAVITKLAPGTVLRVKQRTSDNQWLQVTTPQGTEGWVMRQFVDLAIDLAQVPAVAPSASAEPASGSSASAGQPVVHQQAPVDDPNFSLGARAHAIYAQGQSLGNHPNVFSLIGDSNTANTAFLAPFDWGAYNLGPYSYLQSTVDFFRGSFIRNRIAARGGFNTTKELDPANAPDGCGGASPLACEIQNSRPSVALVLLGTGDQHTWQTFEGRYRQIIEYLIGQGVIPVLMTKGDDLEATDSNAPLDYINSIIRRLSGEYGVPLLNVRQAMAGLPNRGFEADNFHFNKPPDGQSANLNSSYLIYGYNMLNLTAMRALDAIRRQVLR